MSGESEDWAYRELLYMALDALNEAESENDRLSRLLDRFYEQRAIQHGE